MARIELSEGFKKLNEGASQLLTIESVNYDPKFGKAQVVFVDADGGSQAENYMMGRPGAKPTRGQQVAQAIFSTMAKCALHDWSIEDIDTDDLVGQQVVADVTRDASVNEDTGETRYYTHVRNFKEADSEDDELFA